MSRSSNCFQRADGRQKWLWHIRFMWFMSLFTSLPPNTSRFYEQTSVASRMQLQDCSKDTVVEQDQFSLLLGCFCHQHFQQKMQFDSIKMCSQRTADFSGNDEDFGALFFASICAGLVALDEHALCRGCVTADFVAPLSEPLVLVQGFLGL